MKNRIFIIIFYIVFLFFSCKQKKNGGFIKSGTIVVKDDSGRTINLDKPAVKIISLYSGHTENLIALGLVDEIIGVYKNDGYIDHVKNKKKYDYRTDPEIIIAANPDLVLIRPFIERSFPNFVKALEQFGIKTVSMYPESFEEFDGYIKKLALLTGREKKAEELLKKFHYDLNKISKTVKNKKQKVKVFFEVSEINYRTVSKNSLPDRAIDFAGGINIVDDINTKIKGLTVINYSIEKLLQKSKDIDVYVAQKGTMNSNVTEQSIHKRPGFGSIKAIQENRILIIDEKLISRPTFNYIEGVKELAGFFYPDIKNEL